MKMIEIQYASEIKELEKLEIRLEKAKAKLEKSTAKAEKLNATWTREEHLEWLKTLEADEYGFIRDQEAIKRNGAWFDHYSAGEAVKDIEGRIERAKARLEKKEQAVEEYRSEIAKIEDLKKREELRKLEFEQEQKEWAKDGITLERRYSGTTPSGKHFYIERNSGYTLRSLHCFTLYIDGETIFTSGEFWRAYAIIKKN